MKLTAAWTAALTALVACSSSGSLEGGSSPSRGGASGGNDGAPTGSDVEPTSASPEACASPAPAVFGNALCLCGDFRDVGNLDVRGDAAANLGSVGVNGATRLVNNTHVEGGWASGGDVAATGNFDVGRSLYAHGDLSVTGNVDVAGNLEVGGDLSGIGRLAIGGELRQKGTGRVLGYQKAAGVGAYAAPAGPPCGCDGAALLDVARAVADAKASNDDAARGVNAGALSAVGATDLTLAGGRYYFDATKGIGLTRIRVTAPVAMFVEGSLEQIGAGLFELAPGATLDLYVSGSVKTVGYTQAGDGARPEAFRLYVGGADEVSLSVGAQVFRGSIYAPKAALKYVGHTRVEGGLFARELTGIGNLEIRGARPARPAGCGNGSATAGSAGGAAGGTGSAGSGSAGSGSASSGGTAGGSGGGDVEPTPQIH